MCVCNAIGLDRDSLGANRGKQVGVSDEPVRVTMSIGEEGSDAQRLDELTSLLRAELLDLDVAVAYVPAGPAPDGARSGTVDSLASLVVTLAQSPVLAAIINAVSTWLGQRRQRTVKLEIDGDVLELSGNPSAEQRRLTDEWLRRRETADPGLGGGGRYALIVANYDYQDPGLTRLQAPERDADQLAAVLRDPKIGGFAVHTLLNESAATINEAVEDFFADREPDDLLLLYFSGHGVKDENGELYLAAAATKLNRLGATAVAADFVNRRMNRSRSRRIVLLLDCCYSGAFGRGMVARAGASMGIQEQFGGHGRAVITASSAMEYAFEGLDLADSNTIGPSVFTRALIEGLDTGNADRDQDGYVGLDELYDYVYEHVQRTTPNQTPGKWTFDLRGELRVARRARPVSVPTPLPQELYDAIDHPLSGMRAGAVGELERLLNGGHAGLALAARIALERLADDDSRNVGSAAAKALGRLVDPVTPPAAPPVTPPSAEPATPTRVPAPVAAEPLHPSDDDEVEPILDADQTPRTTSRRRAAVMSIVVRVLAGLAAVEITHQYSGMFGYIAQFNVFARLVAIPVWLWLLVGCLLVVTFSPRDRRERTIAHALVIGLSGGMLAVLSEAVDVVGRSSADAEFRATAAGVLGGLLAVLIGLVPRPKTGPTVTNALTVAVVLTAFVPLNFLSFDDLMPFSGLTTACLIALTVANVTIWVVRWRRFRTARLPLALGAISTALVVFDGLAAQTSGGNVLALVLYPAAPIVLAINVLLDESRAVSLVVVRLSLILGMLVLDVPSYNHIPAGLIPVSVHPFVEIAAAGSAVVAYYVTADHRSRDGGIAERAIRRRDDAAVG